MLLALIAWLSIGARAAAPADPLSVYSTKPKTDLLIAAGATAGSAVVYLAGDGLIDKRCPCDPHSVNAFDRGAINNHSGVAADLSNGFAAVAIAAPVLADWRLLRGHDEVFKEDLLVYTETLALETSLVTMVKYIAQRPLPRTYAGDPDMINSARGYRSMYSGHTAITSGAFSAAAMTATLRYGTGAWPWLAAGGTGLLVGMERVAAGDHFYTDVGVGLLAGMSVGAAVPWLHRRKKRANAFDVDLVPVPGGGSLRFRF